MIVRRIVHEDVEPAELLEHVRPNALGRAVGHQIFDDDERPRAGLALDLVGELLEQVLTARDHRDATTFDREHFRSATADAAARSGDEADFSAELKIHLRLPSRWPRV